MSIVKQGDTIRIHYVGKFENGVVFDSTEEDSALQLTLGSGEYLAAFEQGVIGMKAGESKTIHIPAENAYGLRDEQKVFEFSRERAPEDFNPEIGQELQMFRADGHPISVTVTGKSDKSFTMDCNHPLAGKNLIFEITLEEIV